ncbi:MAG TPA: BadF/BadG/BcrA/BcrD ATPase family protein [Terriglobales bacterium]|nr:BadF/BadG/BcrA/BcrD ATPase family protein [Terriglobales bacterium]
MALFLGIDGGGSKTECMVGDENSVLGWAGSSASKIARVGEEAAGVSLRECVQRACAAARVAASQIQRTCMGVAGASQADAVAAIRRLLGEIVGGEIEVVGDTEVAHHAAFNGGAGVVVISGTGSIAYGRNQQQETARAGGLAPPGGDPGSGYWVGRVAVELALLASEHSHSPALLNDVLTAWKLQDFQELARVLKSPATPDFAALFPRVAVSPDPVARRVLARAGRELALLAAEVLTRLWPQSGPVEVALYGGVLENSAEVRDSFRSNLYEGYPEARIAPGRRRPAEGALLMARKATVAKTSPETASV